MCTQIKILWNELDQKIIVNKRELLLGITTCTLAGILLGMILSPRKTVTIGSHNGSNNSGNTTPLPQEITVSPSGDEVAE